MTQASTAQPTSPDNATDQPSGGADSRSGDPKDRPGEPTELPGGPGDRPAGGVADIVRRRLAPLERRLDPWSWVATLVVTAIAAVLRLIGLSHPKGKIFDEVYYATDAHSLLVHGFEWDEKSNTAAYVVHPPLGKWMIAIGERLFGYNELGWRFSAAVVGTLAVLLTVRIGRRMFRSTMLGCAAGLLMALDGFQLVLSRTALLDIFLLFFVLAAFGALVVDRDARRGRWLRALEGGLDPTKPGREGRLPLRFPASVPWWRLLSAVLLGCAVSVKWSALYFLPAFLLLMLFWEVGARRAVGVRRPWRDTLIAETGWFFAFGVLVAAAYVASWSGWLLTDGGYFRHWLAANGKPEPPVIGALQNLAHYHIEAYKFHTTLEATHPYQSWPWQWLLLGRPVAFYWSNAGACGASSCAAETLLLGTPVLWWSFLPALAGLAWLGIARRDWRAGAILLCVAAGLLPWFKYALDGRTMFFFYAAPAEPFLILAVVFVLGALMSPVPARSPTTGVPVLEPTPERSDRRLVGAVVAGAYVLLVAICFAYFWPIFIGQDLSYADWSARMWLGGRWI
ncbi:dolichyl-phosphate-mannose--protein mannosyltransferase [Micromonospora zhanjiangensis]|uniref:Polyprenol-phosphate-mannose--protein mannosyltransferase n=1 Tax=Micromonospora zhanjiangensis TaxID=1522057 RepID=A0ABV8KF81_9ACTN